MFPEREPSVDPELQREESQFLEARDLRLGEVLEREVRERRAAPEAERLAQQRRRVLRPGGLRLRDEPFEPAKVERFVAHPHEVARRARADRGLTQRLPE